FAGGHEGLAGLILGILPPGYVAVGQYARQDITARRLLNEEPGDGMLAQKGPGVTHRRALGKAQRLLDHEPMAALDLRDLARLPCDTHAAMDKTNASFKRQGFGPGALGDTVPVRRHPRQCQGQLPREACREADVAAGTYHSLLRTD